MENTIKSHSTTIFLWFSYGFPIVIIPPRPSPPVPPKSLGHTFAAVQGLLQDPTAALVPGEFQQGAYGGVSPPVESSAGCG